MPAVHGTARKFIISLNNTIATSYEVLVMVDNNTVVFTKYAILGTNIDHDIDFIIDGTEVIATIHNNEPYTITAEIRPLS